MADRRAAMAHLGGLLATTALVGCALLPGVEPLRVTLADMASLPGEGMEMRLLLKLRVQNPNSAAIEFQGVSVTLELRGSTLASGVSSDGGSLPGYGERVLSVPVSVSAMAALRQVFSVATDSDRALDYVLRGRLGGSLIGYPFESSGKLDLPMGTSKVP